MKDHHPQLKSDLRRGYSKFSYIVYSTNSTKIIFRFTFVDSSLSLITATKYGELLGFARKIDYSEKEKYIDIFDREIMNKIN